MNVEAYILHRSRGFKFEVTKHVCRSRSAMGEIPWQLWALGAILVMFAFATWKWTQAQATSPGQPYWYCPTHRRNLRRPGSGRCEDKIETSWCSRGHVNARYSVEYAAFDHPAVDGSLHHLWYRCGCGAAVTLNAQPCGQELIKVDPAEVEHA
jgi:hypothetical protein